MHQIVLIVTMDTTAHPVLVSVKEQVFVPEVNTFHQVFQVHVRGIFLSFKKVNVLKDRGAKDVLFVLLVIIYVMAVVRVPFVEKVNILMMIGQRVFHVMQVNIKTFKDKANVFIVKSVSIKRVQSNQVVFNVWLVSIKIV